MSEEQTDTEGSSPQSTAQEERFIREFAQAALTEQRRARRWGIFFKLAVLVYLLAFLVVYLPSEWITGPISTERHTALIEIKGVISHESEASADRVVSGLRAAFENENTVAIILRINSPGGSPVQAGYINDEIHRLREQYPEIPVYSVIVDTCASGGYYIAVAADEIYADKASIVGSIGVRMDGFGFVEAIEKLGVERRLVTAGNNKGFLDPFLPIKEEELRHVEGVLEDIHEQFINTVKRGRRDRLADDEKLYSGLVWTGEQGLELGLVDALGSSSFVAREIVGVEKIVDFTVREDYLSRLTRKLGAAIAESLVTKINLQ